MNSKNHGSLILVLFLFLILSTLGKVYLKSNHELKLAEEFVAKKNFTAAVTHYERSIQWYVPGLKLQEPAALGLWNMAQKFEAQNDSENAINAYRLLRGAFYSVRSFYTPGKKWIRLCNEKIADLMARKPATSDLEKTLSYEERRAGYQKLLATEKPPRPLWALLAVFGFMGWVACTLLFIFFAMEKSGKIKPRPALLWVGGFLFCYGLWIAGLFYT